VSCRRETYLFLCGTGVERTSIGVDGPANSDYQGGADFVLRIVPNLGDEVLRSWDLLTSTRTESDVSKFPERSGKKIGILVDLRFSKLGNLVP
jgi:hypothetical protein